MARPVASVLLQRPVSGFVGTSNLFVRGMQYSIPNSDIFDLSSLIMHTAVCCTHGEGGVKTRVLGMKYSSQAGATFVTGCTVKSRRTAVRIFQTTFNGIHRHTLRRLLSHRRRRRKATVVCAKTRIEHAIVRCTHHQPLGILLRTVTFAVNSYAFLGISTYLQLLGRLPTISCR